MIFIDRSVPRSVARALQQVRDDVRWLDELFPHGTRDPVWLRHCGEQGWLVISRDKKLRTRPAERAAIERYGVGAFIISARKNLTPWLQLELVVTHLKEMERLFANERRPFVYTLTEQGLQRR